MVTREQRRRRLARQHWERQQVRRATNRRRARRNGIIVAVVVGILAVAAVIYIVFFLLRGDSSSAAARPGTSAGIGVLAAPPAAPGAGYILGNGADRPRHGEQRVGPVRLVPVVAKNPMPRDSSLATVTRPRSIAGAAGTGQAASSIIGKDVKVTTT